MTESSASSPSSAGAQLPFDWRQLVDQVKQRRLHRKFRPLPSFADYRLFSRPHNTTEAWTRLELNLGWFWSATLLTAPPLSGPRSHLSSTD